MKTLNETLSSKTEDLMYSQEYAEYIMQHADLEVVICNGDTLLQAQEAGYLFDEFLMTRQGN
jgi:hypothetical protein